MVLATGVLVGLVGTSSAQFISLDGTTEPILAHAKSNDVLLTAEMPDASLKEVAGWLTRSRLNYVLDQSALDSEKRATFHFKDVPGRQVLKTVAETFDLQLTEVEGVAVLRRPSAPLPPVAPITVQAAKVAPLPPSTSAQNNELDKAVQAAEAAAKEAENATDLATARAAARKAAEAARKAAELARSRSRFEFSFGEKPFKNFRMDPKAMEEMQEAMKQFKAFALDDKAIAEMQRAMAEAGKNFGPMFKSLRPREFLKSLTDEQKKLLQSRGYLRMGDLTDKQRELLGNPQGAVNFSFSVEGQKIDVRGEESI